MNGYRKITRHRTLHLAFQALHSFVASQRRLPLPHSDVSADAEHSSQERYTLLTTKFTHSLMIPPFTGRRWRAGCHGERAKCSCTSRTAGWNCCEEHGLHGPGWPGPRECFHWWACSSWGYQGESDACNISPSPSVFAAFCSAAAFVSLQACSRKFTPLQQWLYFDALECLPENGIKKPERTSSTVRVDVIISKGITFLKHGATTPWLNLTFFLLPDRMGRGTTGRLLCLGLHSRRSLHSRSISWWGQVWCFVQQGAPSATECRSKGALILLGVYDGPCRKRLWLRWHFLHWPLGVQGLMSTAKPFPLFPLNLLF